MDDDRPVSDLELHMGADGRVEVWRLVHRVFCPVHERELDVHGCLACKAATPPPCRVYHAPEINGGYCEAHKSPVYEGHPCTGARSVP